MIETYVEHEGQRYPMFVHGGPDLLGRRIRRIHWFYERDLLNVCRRVYRPGTVVFDCGANIGNHTVFYAAVMGARVVAFEPYPPSRAVLERNVAANGIGHLVRVEPFAIGRTAGRGQPARTWERNFGGVVIEPDDAGPIEIRPLDSFADSPVGLIKLDVQGAELAALEGAAGILERDRPLLFIEAETDPAYEAILKFLTARRYVPLRRLGVSPTYYFAPA